MRQELAVKIFDVLGEPNAENSNQERTALAENICVAMANYFPSKSLHYGGGHSLGHSLWITPSLAADLYMSPPYCWHFAKEVFVEVEVGEKGLTDHDKPSLYDLTIYRDNLKRFVEVANQEGLFPGVEL